uniref:Ig-like domain-containing protein n=1 Tax=Edaphovirga cremea TaxID=2267246 RepID=UPI0039890C40
MNNLVDVISRKTAVKTAFASESKLLTVSLQEPSVILVHAAAHDVARYERVGNDLLIYMEDGSVVRCNGYFVEDSGKNHGELVFQDDASQALTHVEFTDTGATLGVQTVSLHPIESALVNLEPLMIGSSSDIPWGLLAAGVLGGGVLGAIIGHSGKGDGETRIIDNTKDVEIANPTFLVIDNQGDSQGVLSANAVTDDTQPTFSGTGLAGSSIQIKDANGLVIASAQVSQDGTWTVQLPAQVDGSHTYSVVQISGDKVTSAGDITLNIISANATLSVGSIAGDNVLNSAEQGAAVSISGTSTLLTAGTAITVTLNGKDYPTTVGENGAWKISVAATNASALAEGVHTITVTGKDTAGNLIADTQTLTVDKHAPVLSIDPISANDVLNAAESGQALLVSGRTDAEAGQPVTVTLNGQQYTALVGADGRWSASVTASDVARLTDGNVTVSASVSDKAGNASSAERSALVDTTVPVVTINTVASDNIINATEHGQTQIISGSSHGAAAGDILTLTVAGQSYTTTVDEAGNWSVGVPASVIHSLADGSVTLTASLTDQAGNSGSATHNIIVNTTAPQLSIDILAQDDVINAVEKGSDLLLSGGSNLADGTTVTVSLNGKNYTTEVIGGQWSLQVPAVDVAQLSENHHTVTAQAVDGVGNSVSANHQVQVDSAIPTVSIQPVTSDDVLNAAEIASGQALSGRVDGAAEGDTVTVMLGGVAYTTQVNADLSWSLNVPAVDLIALGNGGLTVSAFVTNGHGNTGHGSRVITVDANLPGLRVGTVAGDDIINAIEHQQGLIISGTSIGLTPGAQLLISVNGQSYNASVLPDGTWLTNVPAADVANWPAGVVNITVAGQSTAGNPVEMTHPVTVDLTTVAVSINAVATDNVINAAEKGQDLVLSGSTQNVEPGQTVKVSFGGQTYDATVDVDGNWTVTLQSTDLMNVADGDTRVQVSVVNAAGNSASAAQNVHVDSVAPVLSIDPITGDNIINATEAGTDLTVTGTCDAEVGQKITVTLNGNTYEAIAGENGTWSATIPSGDLGALADGPYSISASVADKAGNPASNNRDVLLDTQSPTVTINMIAGDDILNSVEHGQAQIVTGTSSGTVGDSLVLTLNGQSYTTTVDAAGNWSVGVPA